MSRRTNTGRRKLRKSNPDLRLLNATTAVTLKPNHRNRRAYRLVREQYSQHVTDRIESLAVGA